MACLRGFEPPTFGSGAWESYLPLSQTMLSKDTTGYGHGYPVICTAMIASMRIGTCGLSLASSKEGIL